MYPVHGQAELHKPCMLHESTVVWALSGPCLCAPLSAAHPPIPPSHPSGPARFMTENVWACVTAEP